MASASSQDGTWLNPPFSCDSYSPTATSSELTSIACPTPNSTSDVLEANSDASVAVRQRIESSYQGSGPTWSPASLLDPRRAQEQHRNLVVTGGSAAYDPSVLIANGALDFHFSTPADPFAETASEPTVAAPPTKGGNADDDVIILAANAFGSISTTNDETPSSLDTSRTTPQPIGARTPNGTPATRATVGQGETIERLAQAQDRPLEPALKRRKVEGLEPSLKKPNGYLGSGALGDFTVQTNQEHQLKLPGTSKQPVDLTIEDDEDTLADPRNTEVCYGMLKSQLDCHLVPSAKPGAITLLGQGFAPIVKIMLRRRTGEKSHNIEACDWTRKIVGRVAAKTAKGLCPILDNPVLGVRTECRIPSRPLQAGETAGRPTSTTYALDINIYGPRKYGPQIGNHLTKYDLKLVSANFLPPGMVVENPHGVQHRKPDVKRYYLAQNQPLAVGPSRTTEEVRHEVMNVFDSFGDRQNLPEAEADPAIQTPLLTHQKQGLYFMQDRESVGLAGRDVDSARPSIWKKHRALLSGGVEYVNVITGSTESTFPEPRAGILADMMGLGKTLSILSLVVGSKAEALEWSTRQPDNPVAPTPKTSKATSLVQDLALTKPKRNAKATLLVCPLSTATNWEEQIKQHIKPGCLSYYIYHGANRIKDAEKLAHFDLVITTYGSVSSELSSRHRRKQGLYPLEEIGWFRIVLDEAHMIREQTTLQFKAIVRLQADRRWAVTGTPVQNRLDDLGALLAFIRFNPFHDRSQFLKHIVDPFKAANPAVVEKLRVLVDTVTIRRLKDKIDLPPRSDEVVRLDFSPDERKIYELFNKNAKDRVQVLSRPGGERALRGNTFMHILRSILRLRLICAHGKDLLNEEDLAVLEGMTAETAIDLDSDDDDDVQTKSQLSERRAYEMLQLMRESNNDGCSNCQTKLGSNDSASIESEGQEDLLGFMNPCFHLFCCTCIAQAKGLYRASLAEDGKTAMCYICHQNVAIEFVQLKRTKAEVETDGLSKLMTKPSTNSSGKGSCYSGPSTKARALIQDLLRHKEEGPKLYPNEPPIKSVVFSAWTSHLDLLERALHSAGIPYTRLDGTMTRVARTAAMDAFREDDDVHVILVSIMAGGLGLNLTAGNNVYVMEPQYNPAAEAQAVDRVHRLGQKRPVKTVRYIMRNSFEEKMLELQDKKRKLASLSMDNRERALDKAEATRQKLLDLRSLFR